MLQERFTVREEESNFFYRDGARGGRKLELVSRKGVGHAPEVGEGKERIKNRPG